MKYKQWKATSCLTLLLMGCYYPNIWWWGVYSIHIIFIGEKNRKSKFLGYFVLHGIGYSQISKFTRGSEGLFS